MSLVFSPNAGKYGPEITPYLDTFHAVSYTRKTLVCANTIQQRKNIFFVTPIAEMLISCFVEAFNIVSKRKQIHIHIIFSDNTKQEVVRLPVG